MPPLYTPVSRSFSQGYCSGRILHFSEEKLKVSLKFPGPTVPLWSKDSSKEKGKDLGKILMSALDLDHRTPSS